MNRHFSFDLKYNGTVRIGGGAGRLCKDIPNCSNVATQYIIVNHD